jgi:hypothetical protein
MVSKPSPLLVALQFLIICQMMYSARTGILAGSLFVLMLISEAHGQGFGVGIIAGNPTGVSVKKWLHNNDAVDAAAAWSFDRGGAFQIHADYLWHRELPAISRNIYGAMPFYLGLGGRVTFGEAKGKHGRDNYAGLRVPFGMTYLFENAPVDLFIEVAPILDVAPRADFELDAAAGVRFYLR